MLLVLPFGGYVSQRLHSIHSIAPRIARLAGLGFAFSFGSTLLAMVMQLAHAGVRSKDHNFLAYASVGFFLGGMACCCCCALKDRFRFPVGKRSLPGPLTLYWLSSTLLPIGCLACIAVLVLLGQYAGQTWAEEFRQSFRTTMFWRLAFWEWI